MPKAKSDGALRRETEQRMKEGWCVYCRRPASPDRPLTREHVVPQARGGGRRDPRIIVPACAECNSRRGSQEIVRFLLLEPRRLSIFLDYLLSLPAAGLQQLDPRVLAEICAAVWLLSEHPAAVAERFEAAAECGERRLHRRRYAARRALDQIGPRLERWRDRSRLACGPSCLLPPAEPGGAERFVEQVRARLIDVLSLRWSIPAHLVGEELAGVLHHLPATIAGESLSGAGSDRESRRPPSRRSRGRSRRVWGRGAGAR